MPSPRRRKLKKNMLRERVRAKNNVNQPAPVVEETPVVEEVTAVEETTAKKLTKKRLRRTSSTTAK